MQEVKPRRLYTRWLANLPDEVVMRWNYYSRTGVGRHGDFVRCKYLRVLGVSYDGGYAEYVVAAMGAAAGGLGMNGKLMGLR
jgi:hypothetical protein